VGLTRLLAVLALAAGLLAAAPAESAEPASAADPLVNRQEPRILGEARYGQVLRAAPGRWSPTPRKVRFQWLRGGEPIPGATRPRYEVGVRDVGRALRVVVRVKADGHAWTQARSTPVRALHRVRVRRTVTYSVQTRGRVTADLREFRRLVQQTYDDPRGWRAAGVRFVPVRRGGAFTVVLAEARTLPSFSSVCSVEWSCRVGRYVVINQTRWQHASPAWNAARGPLRGYRHMVVNHETGHWLGFGHAGCPRAGVPAPVMMQQSKGLDGCRFNPFPTRGELARTH
jgi:hypothetical protein